MDCRLCCLDGAVLCSKVVLASHSPLLADILRSSKASLVTGTCLLKRCKQCWGSVTFLCGSGSPDPRIRTSD
jgi:hypothetical protein